MLVSLHRAQAGWVVGWFGGSVVGAAGASSCRQLLSATPAAATFEAPCSWLSWQLRQASCALCPALLRTPFAFRLSPYALRLGSSRFHSLSRAFSRKRKDARTLCPLSVMFVFACLLLFLSPLLMLCFSFPFPQFLFFVCCFFFFVFKCQGYRILIYLSAFLCGLQMS